jgi:hypothetical protein
MMYLANIFGWATVPFDSFLECCVPACKPIHPVTLLSCLYGSLCTLPWSLSTAELLLQLHSTLALETLC